MFKLKFKNNFKKLNEETKIKKNQEKTEYAKLKNDRERIDFLASKLGVL